MDVYGISATVSKIERRDRAHRREQLLTLDGRTEVSEPQVQHRSAL
jgi:hypothetical protein